MPVLYEQLSLEQVYDCWRTPTTPDVGEPVEVYFFEKPYKSDGNEVSSLQSGHYLKINSIGKISTLTNIGLKNDLESKYPGKDYNVVRLDEYDEYDVFIDEFSQGGILYVLDDIHKVYLFVASRYDSNNSYGYLICLDATTMNTLYENQSGNYIVQKIVDDIN